MSTHAKTVTSSNDVNGDVDPSLDDNLSETSSAREETELDKGASSESGSIKSSEETKETFDEETASGGSDLSLQEEQNEMQSNESTDIGNEFQEQNKTERCTQKDSENSPFITNTSAIESALTSSQPGAKQLQKDEFIKNTKTVHDNGYIEEDVTMPSVEVINCPKGIMRDLAEPYFDVWRLDRDSMIDHIEYMYHDLGVVRAWKIPRSTLRMFLLGVRERYQDNPYHNFKHCFCVTQMAYSIICKLRLRNKVSVDHLGALLTAAVCHDVDHPGLNNSYHCHARTPLAILYNYKSILEQHHFAVACRILSNKEQNIFRNVNNRDEVLTNVGDLILATDLARHKDVMETYRCNIDTGFDFKNNSHVLSLLKIIIKCADVSNEVRPETVASPWVDRLFAEYSEQSAREKRERLPVTTYMDPDLVNVPESQEGFIRGIMLPMYDELCRLATDARAYFISPLHEALLRYEIQNMRERGV
ncbi:high affinity cGMP-specific 3',5'-cyclic phosphodiesterase 9A isoform X1 [Ciona intestinalis]